MTYCPLSDFPQRQALLWDCEKYFDCIKACKVYKPPYLSHMKFRSHPKRVTRIRCTYNHILSKSAKADVTNYIDQLKLSVVINYYRIVAAWKKVLPEYTTSCSTPTKLRMCTWKSTTVSTHFRTSTNCMRVPLKINLICFFFSLWVAGNKITQDFMLIVMLADLTI